MFFYKVFGKGFVVFYVCGFFGGVKDGDVGFVEVVFDVVDEGCFWVRDDEVNVVFFCEFDEVGVVVGFNGGGVGYFG